MKKTAYYSDLLFAFSLSSFCVLFILRYFKIPLVLSCILAVVCGLTASFLLFLLLNKKRKLFALKKSEEAEKEALFLYLALATEQERVAFFQPRLPFLLKELPQENVDEQPRQNQTLGILFLQGYAFFPLFLFREITSDDVANLYQSFKSCSASILLGDKFSLDAQTLAKRLGVRFFDGNEVYRALKKHDAIPKDFPIKTTTPIKRKRRNIAFAKSNSRRFFSSGAILLASSLFIPYSAYYIAVGCVLLITAVLVRIFGYR